MTLTFLGTGTSQGVPVIACNCPVCSSGDPRDQRLRTSALITTDNGQNILIDIGPDFRQQMLTHRVTHLDAVLITHPHRDHVAGLDDIRPFNYLQNKKIDLYGNQQTLHTLQRDYHYIFQPHPLPGLPEANLHLLTGNQPLQLPTITVNPIKALHKDLPILGYRLQNLAYITDANHIPPDQLQKLRGLHTLVINALRTEKHPSHFSLPEALQIISSLQPRQAYITHIGHEMGLTTQVSLTLPKNVHLAYDGLKIKIIN